MNSALHVIMAGGKGSRLMPLTARRPKPLVRFGSRGTIADYTLYNCLSSGNGDAVVIGQHLGEQLRRYIRVYWSQAFSAGGRNIRTILPEDASTKAFHGTADALYKTLISLGELPSQVVYLCADHVYKMDYREIVDYHLQSGKPATLAAVARDKSLGKAGAVPLSQKDGRVTGLGDEAEQGGPAEFASAGIYVFDTRALAAVLQYALDGTVGPLDLEADVMPQMAQDGDLGCFSFGNKKSASSYWRDIDDLETYRESQLDMLHRVKQNHRFSPLPGMGRLPFALQDMVDDYEGKDCRVQKSAVAKTARFGKSVVENSILCPGVVVGDGAVVKNSVVLDGAVIHRGAKVFSRVVPPWAKTEVSKTDYIQGSEAMENLDAVGMTGTNG